MRALVLEKEGRQVKLESGVLTGRKSITTSDGREEPFLLCGNLEQKIQQPV